MHEALKPWSPSRQNPWDYDAALHLWRRAGFLAPRAEIERTLRRTPEEAVAAIVKGPAADAPAQELEGILEATLGTGNSDSARAWLITRMMRCKHQLREKLALFWHSHFATSIAKVKKLDWMMRQYRIFLDHGLGDFATLLKKVTRDPAMIRWLDNETNSKGQPNENFARELLELFTLGEGNYTEKDVQEAGRAFTGWHLLHDRFHFSPLLHDTGEKTVLGRTGALGGDDVCRIALEQDACGRFLASKLITFFCVPEPDDDVVAAFGAELKRNGYDIAAALRLLLGSRLFFAEGTRRALIKSPLEFVVGAQRGLEGRVSTKQTVGLLRDMGQDLLAPPNVKGWPGQRAWINTATWLTRVNAAWLIAGASRAKDPARSLLGAAPVPPELRGTGRVHVHALLSLPEAHLA